MSPSNHVFVFVNHSRIEFDHHEQTGCSIKQRANIPLDHTLCADRSSHGGHEHGKEALCNKDELTVIADDQMIKLQHDQHFWSIAPVSHGITVTINKKEYEFDNPHQTGRALKERAGIPDTDVLFRDQAGEDEVITDDAKIVLHCGDCFHSSPPADYGNCPVITPNDVGFEYFETVSQPDGWTFLLVPDYPLPDGFSHHDARLLIKLPPLFPDAAPDMFWLNPSIRTSSGGTPQGTSTATLLGAEWQQFSWHLSPGAWRAGLSTLRDFMRCIRARLEKRN